MTTRKARVQNKQEKEIFVSPENEWRAALSDAAASSRSNGGSFCTHAQRAATIDDPGSIMLVAWAINKSRYIDASIEKLCAVACGI